jgi:hypothetical protein
MIAFGLAIFPFAILAQCMLFDRSEASSFNRPHSPIGQGELVIAR